MWACVVPCDQTARQRKKAKKNEKKKKSKRQRNKGAGRQRQNTRDVFRNGLSGATLAAAAAAAAGGVLGLFADKLRRQTRRTVEKKNENRDLRKALVQLRAQNTQN